MVNGELVRFSTEDSVELQGFFVDAQSDIGYLHIHGLSDNFYENPFTSFLAELAANKGMKFLSANNRGHDYINELFKKEPNEEIISIGGSLEKFEECIFDIRAGIDFLKKQGCKKIILQGHSSGCTKVTYYKAETEDDSVVALVLLAPADDKTIGRSLLGEDYDKFMNNVRDMIKDGRGKDYLPKHTVTLPVISAERLYSLFDEDSIEANVFDYNGKMKEFTSLDIPILAIFGERDKWLVMPAEKTLGILKAKNSKCEIDVIKDAPHNFRGHEKELIEAINKWIDSLGVS